jgi:hypothetical protein
MFENNFHSGQRSEDEEAEAKGFGGADAVGDGGAELRGISDGEFALELDGRVSAIGRPILMEKFAAARKGAE